MDRRSLLVGALAACAGGARARAEDAFVKLYNGKDLSGWHVESGKLSSWKANGEMISCVASGGGYLATDREYGDFELRVGYRIGPAGNSGLGIRFPPGAWPSTAGMEIQILDDDSPKYKSLKPDQYNGSIYTHSAPKARAARPAGEWNQFVVLCRGPRVAVRLNGVEIQNIDLDAFSGSLGKGKIPLSERPRKGLIGLQSHGDLVDFKGIEIREL
jgi:hypothetical protein